MGCGGDGGSFGELLFLWSWVVVGYDKVKVRCDLFIRSEEGLPKAVGSGISLCTKYEMQFCKNIRIVLRRLYHRMKCSISPPNLMISFSSVQYTLITVQNLHSSTRRIPSR